MVFPSVFCAAVAAAASLVAAAYGYKAGKVKAEPVGPDWDPPGTGGIIEPLTTELNVLDATVRSMRDDQAILAAMAKAGRLNMKAVWAALVAAVAGLASAILGAI